MAAGRRVRPGRLLPAGDAYVWQEEMNLARPYCTPRLRAYQWLMQKSGWPAGPSTSR